MINFIDSRFKRLNTQSLYTACTALVFLVGLLDYLTGFEISFFIFYALPIWLAAWYGGKHCGLFFAFVSILGWSIANTLTGHIYSHPMIPYWNGAIRLAFFVFTAYALDAMKEKLRLEELNADFDALTGILNGRGFRDRASVVFPLLKREKHPYAIAFIDVDNFKTVNDTKGHAEGDAILMKVAAIMKKSLRESDIAGRLGGDEFVILLPRTNDKQARVVISNLKNTLDDAADDEAWPIGFSFGVGIFSSETTALDDGIRLADDLMYKVKRGGKGQIRFADMSGTHAKTPVLQAVSPPA